jgi:hypothetical protein
MAATALPIERVISIGGLTGLAHGRSDARLLFSVLSTASHPPIPRSTSLTLSGVPRTTDNFGDRATTLSGFRASATTSCLASSAHSRTHRPVRPVAPSTSSFNDFHTFFMSPQNTRATPKLGNLHGQKIHRSTLTDCRVRVGCLRRQPLGRVRTGWSVSTHTAGTA